MKTYYNFKSIADFQHFLRTKEYKSGELDYVNIGKKLFTMHEYDNDGRMLSWANKKHDVLIECNTANRYRSFKDAILYRFNHYGALRDDITYAQ